ncbi:hypothetical protein PG997_001624 [Apiospora hydei]|uniref:Uncharacterized protein n=1 Tax=Apiospora hydei TaxID=1337664 RepID=A0ABR1XEC3_9PEZI
MSLALNTIQSTLSLLAHALDRIDDIMGYTFQDAVNDPSEGKIIILSLVTIPLCVVATTLRLFAPKRPGTHGFRWDDLFAVLALVGFLGYAISPLLVCSCVFFFYGNRAAAEVAFNSGIAVSGDMSDDDLAILSAKVRFSAQKTSTKILSPSLRS